MNNIRADNALVNCNARVLRVLAPWYLNNFDIKLEHGLLSRMLQVASSQGDSELGSLAFKVRNYVGGVYCWCITYAAVFIYLFVSSFG
jgi:hypothetical protein